MKKYICLLTFIVVLLNTICCTNLSDSIYTNTSAREFEVYATNSRTANNGDYTVWCDSDNITLFHTESESENYICDGKFTITNTATGRFVGVLSEELSSESRYDWYAFYPHHTECSQFGINAAYTIGCTITDGIQIQKGNNNSDHIAGENLPLVGVARSVAGNNSPSLSMQNAASFAKIAIKNCVDRAITISRIEITAAGEHLIGKFSITPTAEAVICTPIANQTADTATLVVENGAEISTDEMATFYIAVAPFTLTESVPISFKVVAKDSSDSEIICSKSVTPTAGWGFSAGKYKSITFKFEEQGGGSLALTGEDMKGIDASWGYTNTDIKYFSTADGNTWSAYKAYRGTAGSSSIGLKADYPEGYLATPKGLDIDISKIVINIKSTALTTKFALYNGVAGELLYTSDALGRTTQDWTVDIPAKCSQIAIRAAQGTITINSVTLFYE